MLAGPESWVSLKLKEGSSSAGVRRIRAVLRDNKLNLQADIR